MASSSGPSPSPFTPISAAKQRLYTHLATRRPWSLLLDPHSLSLPHSFPSHALSRLKTNLSYFRVNFSIIILIILFLSLLWHPISLIVFILMMAAWLFFFFLRDQPLILFGRTIDDRIILIILSILTILFLLLTGPTLNILISLLVGVVIVVVYSIFRTTDDLFMDEQEAVAGGLLAGRPGFGPASYPLPTSSSTST